MDPKIQTSRAKTTTRSRSTCKKKREEIFQSSNQHQPTRLAVVLFMIPPRFHHVSMKSRSYSSTSKARPWLGTVLPAACGFRQTPGMGRFGRKNWGMMVLDGLGGLEAWRLGGFLLSLMCQGAINISVSTCVNPLRSTNNCSTSPGLVDGIHEWKSMRESMKTRWCLNHGCRMMHQHASTIQKSQSTTQEFPNPVECMATASSHINQRQDASAEIQERLGGSAQVQLYTWRMLCRYAWHICIHESYMSVWCGGWLSRPMW